MMGDVRMQLVGLFGPPIYSQALGSVTAEVYRSQEGYKVFIVGDLIASFLGTAKSLEDCKEEIKSLERLVNSDLFQRGGAEYS